jgi:hypothetical protein
MMHGQQNKILCRQYYLTVNALVITNSAKSHILFFHDIKLILLIESRNEVMEHTRTLLKEIAMYSPNITNQSTSPEPRNTAGRQFTLRGN